MVVERPTDITSETVVWAASKTSVREQWRPISDELRSSFADEPIEDCVSHPAEQIVQREAELLRKAPPGHLLGWLVEEGGEFAASVLACLGRCDVPNFGVLDVPVIALGEGDAHAATDAVSWRLALVRSALKSPDIRVRDSAVQAVENWESEALLAAFESHEEPVPWLREYIAGVQADLTK